MKGVPMRRCLPVLTLFLAWAGSAPAQGLLLPDDRAHAPFVMVDHHVRIQIDEQVAVTRVEQSFRNNSSRPLEATYLFPVPRGASVNKFTMWVDGREVRGEILEAAKAR